MRIGVNARLVTGDKMEGVGRFIVETLERMIQKNREHDFVLFFDRKVDTIFSTYPNVTCVFLSPKAIHPVLWYLWFEWRIPGALKKNKIDVFLSPDGFSSLRTDTPVCMVVHDLAFWHYPQFFKKRTAVYYNYFVKRFIKKARTIATVSAFSREDIIKYAGIPPEKVSVVSCAASDQYRPITENRKEEVIKEVTGGKKYFLYIGAIHPRKNVANLVKAFSLFKRQTGSDVKLVLAGRMAWKSDEVKAVLRDFDFPDDVVHLDFVPENKLTEITAAALALVYPSFFEGFGIPILEGMLCDVPVITSNTSSMPEVGGNAALYIDPESVKDIAEKLGRMNNEPGLRNKLIEAGRIQRNKFNWDQIADRLWDCILRARS